MNNDLAFKYLDLWRVICALLVLIFHAQAFGFLGTQLPSLNNLAHHAVIIFFVISGYSIASAAQRMQTESAADQRTQFVANRFLKSRLSRIYSIALPALILAVVLDFASGVNRSDLYPTWQYSKWPVHLGFNALFLGELWGMTYHPFSIFPYWSLHYEVWFYLLLATTLVQSLPRKVILFVLVFALMGPKIWLLLPCWLFGLAVFRLSNRRKTMPAKPSDHPPLRRPLLFAFAVFLGLYAAVLFSDLLIWANHLSLAFENMIKDIFPSAFQARGLSYSKKFLADWIVAALFAFSLVMVSRVPANTHHQTPTSTVARLVKWLAPHTYGIYLLHYTLFAAFAALFASREAALQAGVSTGLAITFSVLVLSVTLSVLFNKTRPAIARLLG
jgi:peptidoglycan/LPS O-acetylase OafA/YrhL